MFAFTLKYVHRIQVKALKITYLQILFKDIIQSICVLDRYNENTLYT